MVLYKTDCCTYLYIQVADLTLTQQVGTVGGQGGVYSASTGLDDLRKPVKRGRSEEPKKKR